MLIDNLIPAIAEKWPRNGPKTIFIQQDNAKPHLNSDEEWQEAFAWTGMDMRLDQQPPNSPYMNVLDLGFLRAIQSLQYEHSPKNLTKLMHCVDKAWEKMPAQNLSDVFLTLQACMLEVIWDKGAMATSFRICTRTL